jgi:hypothetical protein
MNCVFLLGVEINPLLHLPSEFLLKNYDNYLADPGLDKAFWPFFVTNVEDLLLDILLIGINIYTHTPAWIRF